MAVGDLITADYMFEYNNLVFGATTDYSLFNIPDLLGFKVRSTTIDRFGRHGGVSGRHYANIKMPVFEGKFLSSTNTDFEVKRQALASAFKVIVDPNNSLPLVFQLPGADSLKIQTFVRPMGFACPISRDFTRKYSPFIIQFEMPDPILYSLVVKTQVFTLPNSTFSLINSGNAPAHWSAALAGPATNPIITNNDTGQMLSFTELVLTGSDVLTFDSSDSTVKLNGDAISSTFNQGFSWFDLDPGPNNISFSATDANTASFSVIHRDAYWSN